MYEFRGMVVSDFMVGAIRRYVDEGREPGHFLTAVITNDLAEACGRADDENLRALPAFVAYFYNEAPALCWGSRKRMDAWLAKFSEESGV